MKKQFLFILLCVLSFVACTQNDQSLDRTDFRRTLSANVESVLDYTRAGMESDGAFFWHEGDKIGALMTNGNVRPMNLVAGNGGKSTGTFEISTSETIGNYAFYPYNANSSVNAEGQLTINFPAEYNYGSVIGEKENSFGFAMWGQVAHGAVGFKHLGGVFKIYVNDLPVGENMQFSLSTTGKKLTGEFTTTLDCETPVLETSDDSENDTVVITFSNTEENATAVFYVPVPVGTYPVIDVVVKDAAGEDIAFGYWENQTVERRAQKKGTIGKKEVTGGEIDGVYSPEEGVYEISNLAGLKWVADQVNQEITTFEGETIVLTADIDLAGEEWTPIGSANAAHGFMGNFDGNEKTIKNLNITNISLDADGYAYAGLFGVTEGVDKANQNYIKNLTIENVNIATEGHIVAAAVAYPYYTNLENIKVIGSVSIKGGDYTSGVLAYTRRCVDAKNITIAANEGSVIEGNMTIGGVISDIQMNGGLTANYSNFAAENLTIKGAMHVGGISGIISKQTLNGATVKNVTIVCDDVRKGQISGSLGEVSVINDAVIENVNGAENLIGATFKLDSICTVTINGIKYQYNNGWNITGGYQYDAEAKLATIYDVEGLKKFAEEVNGGKSFAGETVVLVADIDLAAQTREAGNWTSIGTSEKPFSGTFDGQGYTIKNLTIIEAEAKESKAYMGFFGYAKNATIKNVVFENVTINIPCLDIDHSQGHIGAVAGSLEGTSTIEDVTVKGDIKIYTTQEANGASRVAVVAGGNAYGNVTMKNVHVVANEGSYLVANNNTGALAGQLQGECYFVDCSSNINVTVNKFFAGGIIGLTATKSSFTNCHTTGDVKVVAGRAGRANDHYRVGGIVGGWSDGKSNVCTLTNCSYTGEVSGVNADGSVATVLDYDGYVGRGYTLTNCAGSKVVIDDKTFEQVADKIYGFYVVDGVYELNSAAAMKWVAEQVSGTNSFAGKSVVMIDDIDLGGEEWKPIGMGGKHFEGTFDGQNHTIKGLKVTARNSGAQAALFCSAAGNAQFKNFTIDEAYVKYPADSNDYYAAAVVGTIYGNLKFEGINVKNSTITGNNKVGAIFAHDGSSTQITVNNCHVDNCYIASEDTADGGCVGGLIGFYATGTAGKVNTISNSSVKNSTIVGINSSNSGKRANSEFIGCIQTKDAMELNIVDCVVAGNSFSQTIDGSAAVTYVGAFPAQFIGGDRNEKLLGNITINGTRVMICVAEVNGVKYATLQEAFNVGGNITLICDVTASESIILAEGKTAVLDLNGFALNGGEESTSKHIYVIKNYGSLTIKDTKGNGSINSRGVYNYGEMILNSGKISAIDGNGGYAVNNQSGSTFVMNGGWIAADYEDGDAAVAGNYDATALNVPSNATATLNGGKITNAGNFTFAINSAGTLNIPAESTLTIEGRHGAFAISGGVTTINAGTYSVPENTEDTDNVVYVSGSGKVIINGGTFIADNDTPNGGSCVCDTVGGATINGGVFGNSSGGDIWGTTGTVIKGGQFSTDPIEYIDTEYYKTTSSNGIYTVVERKYIYLKATHWEVDGARFAAYLWKGEGNSKVEIWVSMEAVDNTVTYRFELPDGFDYGCNIIFCRMNPSATANNWNNKWNQTADLKTPTNGNNLFTVTNGAWNDANGTWSKY